MTWSVEARRMQAPLLQEILDLYPSLPPAERRVADVILGHPRDVIGMTSEDVARRASVSQPTTSRFCGRLTPGTFPAFKIQLAQQVGVQESPATEHQLDAGRVAVVTEPSGADTLLQEAIGKTKEALESALQAISTLSPAALEEAAQTILRAKTIVTCGFDLSGSVAWRLASLLRISGFHARSERDPYGGAYWMDLLAAGDLVIVVSYRGGVPQILDAITRARQRGVMIMAITNEAQSALVPMCDCILLTRAPAARSNDEYTSGAAVYVQFAVIRALWFAVQIEAEKQGLIPAALDGKGAT